MDRNRLYLLGIGMGGEMDCAAKKEDVAKPTWETKFPTAVIAHRGFSAGAPENTLTAFRRAIAAGSDVLELDIHLSKDHELVVVHDRTLERTTNGQGRVADFTLK